MKPSRYFSLVMILVTVLIRAAGYLVFFGYVPKTAALSLSMAKGDCLSILRETRARVGAQGNERFAQESWDPTTNNYWCSLQVEKTVDTRGPVMGQGSFYYEDTSIYIVPNPTSQIENSIGGSLGGYNRQSTTFHGFPALLANGGQCESGCPETFEWLVPESKLQFGISKINYEIPEGETQARAVPFDIMNLAETFYGVADQRIPSLGLPPVGEVVTPQPAGAAPGEPAVPTETGGQSGIPPLIVLGSLGVPMVGALAGAAVASLSSLMATRPVGVRVNDQGQYWSERPWDEAGPGYVSKEEYERTKSFLEQGYKWTKYGWQAPDATPQSSPGGAATGQTLTLGDMDPNAGSLKPAQAPAIGTVNDQGQYWSERPGDVAGPGYVSQAEYEHTKDMLAQGSTWTKDGWQTPDQASQSNQWQQNDRAAVDRKDAQDREKWEAEQHSLEKNKAELKKSADALEAATKMIDLNHGLEALNRDLLKDNVYVHNPYQGDPTMLWDWAVQAKNTVWDGTFGSRYGSKGLTCQGYVDRTFDQVKDLVHQQYGPDAQVQKIAFEERSSIDPERGWLNPKAWKDWCDRRIDDNHNLIKVILPDGTQWAVDFHQHNINIPLTRGDIHAIHLPFVDTRVPPPIVRPWAEVVKVWKPYMGEHEFMEQIVSQ